MSTSQNNNTGYKIIEGSALLTPRRTKAYLGAGGELNRLSPRGLYEMEVAVRREISSRKEKRTDDETQALVARKLAGARAEARAGYAVDGLHKWVAISRHDMYITPMAARMAAANSTLEDVFDAVSTPPRSLMNFKHSQGCSYMLWIESQMQMSFAWYPYLKFGQTPPSQQSTTLPAVALREIREIQNLCPALFKYFVTRLPNDPSTTLMKRDHK